YAAGICGGAGGLITVQLQDSNANAANAGVGGQAFTASSTSAGATFYTDAACGSVVAGGNFTIANGTSSVGLYYRDTKAGSPAVSLSNASSLTNPPAQAETVNA